MKQPEAGNQTGSSRAGNQTGIAVAVEIAVEGPAGARVAAAAGADRVELCSALATTGGITPTTALAQATVAAAGKLPVHALVRCRSGGFHYSDEEIAIICTEIRALADVGVAGVVVGAATGNQLDLLALERMRDAAPHVPNLQFTLHRVIDTLADRDAALRAISELGFTRVLTSGGRPEAPQARNELAAMCVAAHALGPKPIEIMAGGGVRPGNVGTLAGIGLAAVHASCSEPGPATGPTGPGGGTPADSHVRVNDPAQVRALVAAVRTW